MKTFTALLLSILAGGLMILAFRPPAPPWTLPFCFVPLWYCWLQSCSPWRVFWTGWTAQFIFSAGAFYWVAHAADEFFGAPGLQAYYYLIGFSAIAYLSYPLAGTLWFLLKRYFRLEKKRALFLLVLLTGLSEMIYPSIFPLHFGYSWMWSRLEVVQLADIVGFAGLALLTYILNAIWLMHLKPYRALLLNILVLASFSLLGWLNLQRWPMPDSELTVHLYQSNILPIEVLSNQLGIIDATHETLNYFFSRHKPLEGGYAPEISIWPETAMPFDLANESDHLSKLRKHVRDQGTYLITGAYRYKNSHIKHNSLGLFDPRGEIRQIYDKHILMPFGEYLPFEEYFPAFRQWAPNIPIYGFGRDYTPFKIREARIGPSICYESLFPNHFRRLNTEGANIFLNSSSDFWFGDTIEPFMHSYIGLSRALEFRRPLIRVGDIGITTVILADGTMLLNPPVWQEWQGQVKVSFLKDPPLTFFDSYGSYGPWFLLVIALTLLLFPHRRYPA